MSFEQLKVEEFKEKTIDLDVVNCARVSFNKQKEKLDDKDISLIKFLAKHQHTTPFCHSRITFKFDRQPFNPFDLNPFDMAGMVWKEYRNGIAIRTSLFGWINLLNKEIQCRNSIIELLCNLAPYSMEAFNFESKGFPIAGVSETFIVDDWFQDIMIKCSAPIWLTKQLMKHQVTMRWSEVSRRYVSNRPELFNPEYRIRPDNVKQGSAETVENFNLVGIDTYRHTMEDINEGLLDWYEDSVEQNIAPETLRGNLPQNMMTEWIWSGAVPAFKHLLDLRLQEDAQKEIRYFASQIQSILARRAFSF